MAAEPPAAADAPQVDAPVNDLVNASVTWGAGERALPPRPDFAGWRRVWRRGGAAVALLLAGLGGTVLLRVPERLLCGAARPVTGWITVLVCRGVLRLIGLRVRRQGRPDPGARALVANHASWLDILVLNSSGPMYFVSKAEVAGWAGIGWLARVTGTVFIRRSRQEARAHVDDVATRLGAGHRLMLFPEGTSSDGLRVLPFKPTLFAAFAQQPGLSVQPVSLRYHAPAGRDARFYGWWGAMDFGPHALAVLAERRQGHVDLVFDAPIDAEAAGGRKALAGALHSAVTAGFAAAGGATPGQQAPDQSVAR